MDNQPIILQFGQQGFSNSSTEHQPAGVTFREKDWYPPNLGKVHFEHGQHSFDLGSVFSIFSGVSERYKSDGIQGYTIHFGVSDAEYIKHREAYELVTRFTKQLQQKGWQRYIDYNQPRLAGKDAYKYVREEGGELHDPRLNLTYEQWRALLSKLSVYHIQLKANDAILSLSVRSTIEDQNHLNERRRSDLDFNEWGGYLYDMEIRTVKDDIREKVQAFEHDDREKNWLVNWEIEKREWLQDRAQKEQELRGQGYKIDETYQNPPIPEEYLRYTPNS